MHVCDFSIPYFREENVFITLEFAIVGVRIETISTKTSSATKRNIACMRKFQQHFISLFH